MKNRLTTKELYRYGFALIVLVLGLLLSYFKIGNTFLGFSSVGTWLIYIGFIMLAIITLQFFSNKKRIVDERMIFIANKAMRFTLLSLIIIAFIIIVIDGVNTITIPYHLFMAYLICLLLIIYVISYKILLRKY